MITIERMLLIDLGVLYVSKLEARKCPIFSGEPLTEKKVPEFLEYPWIISL